MKITEEQKSLLDSLHCERFSSNLQNLRDIESFYNRRNDLLVEPLRNEAYCDDEELINYYRNYLKFDDSLGRGTAIPLYDDMCKFMYQETNGLKERRVDFYDNFNHDDDAV